MGQTPLDDEREALRRIAAEAAQRTGQLDLIGLRLESLPPGLADLDHLTQLLVGIRTPNFTWRAPVDLSPLAGLTRLVHLEMREMPVRDLSPLSELASLRSLAMFGSGVHDLAPLSSLSKLTEFRCVRCRQIRWETLPAIPGLRRLSAPYTNVSDLRPIVERIPNVRSLELYVNPFEDLGPPAHLQHLDFLDIDSTQAKSYGPLESLNSLRKLNCSSTPARDWHVIRRLCESGQLAELVACEVDWEGVPPEVLSQNRYGDNCLPRLRAHLADLADGAKEQRQTKLMVLGNGRVGKTQLVRRLRHEDYDDKQPSTHGVVVTTATLPPRAAGETPDTLHVWDFGGQDLYHGTHSLFMKSGSAALIAWNPVGEAAGTHVHEGMRFRNEPLGYWLEFVKGSAGATAPLLLVQTQCDRASDEVLNPPVDAELLQGFQHKKLLHTSALAGRGLAALGEALQEAVDALLAQQGTILIGAGRARLIARLAALRDEDARRPEAERQHRTLTLDRFAALCDEVGGISDPAMALDYLHRCGWVFWRDDMFNRAIVLDQAWALENIYAVFHRSHSFHHIRALRGRFTLGLLRDTVWRGRSATECQVLLDMMRSCEVCFEVRAADAAAGVEAEYIAPELLPERALLAESIEAEREKMPAQAPQAELRWDFGFLHSGHLRAALARVGRCAGEQAWYWRDGFLGYEVRRKSWLELGIERAAEGHGGSIRFRAVGAQARELLQEVRGTMPREWGQPAGEREADETAQRAAARAATQSDETRLTPALAFAPSPRADTRPCVAISYAWGDKTPEGRVREALVDRICAEAQSRYALRVWRDADVMKQGERISRFMRELVAHDRIVVVLSEKYLKSEYCMFELSEIWRRAQQDGRAFLDRIVVWALPNARIHTIPERLAVAVHWRNMFQDLDRLVRQEGPALLGDSDMVKYKQMERYAAEVGNMLTLIADTLLPRNDELDFEPFLRRILGT